MNKTKNIRVSQMVHDQLRVKAIHQHKPLHEVVEQIILKGMK